MNESQPVFAWIMELIENDIIGGVYQVDDIIISTTQIAKVYSVNPATAVKAVSRLTEDGILYKKPGIGMCVARGAKEKLIARRKKVFLGVTVREFLEEANTLAIPLDEIMNIISKSGRQKHSAAGGKESR